MPAAKADELVPLIPEVAGGYPRNFIRQAVCEFRFPTLMWIGGAKPPEKFVNSLRKKYPISETVNEVTLGAGESSFAGHAHLFKTSNGGWTVSLKQSSVSLETTRYKSYAEYRDRLTEVIAASQPVIDTEFFTRIGLRYINVLQTAEPLTDWIRQSLISTFDGQGFKGVSDFAGRLAMSAEDGGCLLQHGIRLKADDDGNPTNTPEYIIDIDAYRVDVPVKEAMPAIDAAHRQAFSLFSWAMGPKAKERLQEPKN